MNLYIVGATGLVGRKLIEILNDSSLEFEEMCLFSSKRSAGERIKYKDKYLVVKSEIDEIKDCSLITVDYDLGNLGVGSFGIIGPKRMNYAKMLKILETLSDSISFLDLFE